MSLKDSYLQLATSIERRLKADFPSGAGVDLSDSIDRALLEESRGVQRTLASLRVVVAGIALAFVVAVCVTMRLPWSACLPLLAAALLWVAEAAALFYILVRQGGFRLSFRHLLPILDATFIGLFCAALWQVARHDEGLRSGFLALAAALSSSLAFSGALRLSRSSARLSAGLAVVLFVFVAVVTHTSFAVAAATAAILGVIGFFGGRSPELVRRVVTNEIGRAAMTRRYEEARLAITAREQVLRIVSHDLRNPLNTIAMTTDLLLENVGSEEQRKRQVAMIRRAGDRMNRLVKDLVDVAKLESGQLSIQAREIEAASLLKEADEMLRPLAIEKSLTLDISGNEPIPTIQADGGRILQVLSNLVGNAIKFTPSGGRISVRVRSMGGGVQFSVQDTGPGIPPEHLPHIFGAFWQADPNDRRGIGLGLAICKAIVEAHGGRLWVESRVGSGTTFHFTLARISAPTTAVRLAGAPPQSTAEARPQLQ